MLQRTRTGTVGVLMAALAISACSTEPGDEAIRPTESVFAAISS